MAAPGYNPPSSKCQEAGGGCTAPSRTFFIGGKAIFSEDGAMIGTQKRWRCANGHEWRTVES